MTAWRQLLSTVTPPVVREKLGALGLTKTPVADPAAIIQREIHVVQRRHSDDAAADAVLALMVDRPKSAWDHPHHTEC